MFNTKTLLSKFLLPSILITIFLITSTNPIFAKPNQINTQVQQKFNAAYGGECDSFLADDTGYITPEIFKIEFRQDYQNAPLDVFRLYVFPCYQGAYNQSSVYYSANDYGDIRQIHFAFPNYKLTYKDDEDKIIDQITTKGFSTHHTLTNAYYDEQTQTLHSNSSWRGLGDASSSGAWVFDTGQFILKTYDIDPTYDGEINRIRIYGQGQPSAD